MPELVRRRDLRTLPKADLHLHTVGAMRPATLLELAAAAGHTAPDPRAFTDFAGFQAVYSAAFHTTQTALPNLQRLFRELVEDAAAAGAVWVQPHFDPHIYAELGDAERILDAVLQAAHGAGEALGVGIGLTMTLRRGRDAEESEHLAAFAARHCAHYHAIGLAGDESAHPAEPYARAFAIAREAGLAGAPHAGELAGPASVRTAVETLGATRIAHGIRAAEDPHLLTELAERGISLDVCPTSNKALGVVPSTAEHPLPHLLAAGIPCTLGTDDPLMFGASLLDEYETARTVLGLTDDHLAAIATTSVTTSGAPEHVVQQALRGIADWLSSEEPAAASMP